MAAAEGVEEAIGRARLDNGADELPPTLNDGAISGTGCADVSCAILEVPEPFNVATDADEECIEAARQELEQRLHALEARASQLLKQRP